MLSKGIQHVPDTWTVSGMIEYAPIMYGPPRPLMEKVPLEASAVYTMAPLELTIAKETEPPLWVDQDPEIETQSDPASSERLTVRAYD
jgi:hypothetical protein